MNFSCALSFIRICGYYKPGRHGQVCVPLIELLLLLMMMMMMMMMLLLPASCFLLPASCFLLPASCLLRILFQRCTLLVFIATVHLSPPLYLLVAVKRLLPRRVDTGCVHHQ